MRRMRRDKWRNASTNTIEPTISRIAFAHGKETRRMRQSTRRRRCSGPSADERCAV